MRYRVAMASTVASAVAVVVGLMPSLALAQAKVTAKVYWEQEKPRKVQLQSPSAGSSDFQDRTDHYLGERTFAETIYETVDVVVRYADGSSIPFRVRGQIGNQPFAFTVSKPAGSLKCNYSQAGKLERQSQSTDQSVLIATMQSAQAMLANQAAPCSDDLERRVAKAAFDANCNLAKRTRFFDINPDTRNQLLEAFRGRAALRRIEQQVEACETQVRGQVIAPTARAMRRAIDTGNVKRFKALDVELGVLLAKPEWQDGAEAVALPPEHFEQLREEATVAEARAEADQQSDGDPAADMPVDGAAPDSDMPEPGPAPGPAPAPAPVPAPAPQADPGQPSA